MRPLYTSTAPLDRRAVAKYLLNEELLMENAAASLEQLISRLTHRGSVVSIVCGSGDNGGDGYALARRLAKTYHTRIYEAKEPSSPLCRLQSERARVAGAEWVKKILPCDVLVDCLFGSGFSGELSAELLRLLEQMNSAARIRIACDIPSGLDLQGRVESQSFQADYTLSMGALKVALFSDVAKDLVGEVLVGDLGIARELYEVQSPYHLLESSDLLLPSRKKQNCHKGCFGHVAVISGEKQGAAMLAALSAQRMGAGLVSLLPRHVLDQAGAAKDSKDSSTLSSQDSRISEEGAGLDSTSCYIEIMRANALPDGANTICLGMGLGRDCGELLRFCATSGKLCVIDADACYAEELRALLESPYAANFVLTPHPKEFHALLANCSLFSGTVGEVARNRFELALRFSQAYKDSTLLLKGANPIIAHSGRIYINPLGTSALAKGGSGDVLAGMIAGYLAQGFCPLDAAIHASLAHAQAAKKEKSPYALTPLRLIEHLG